MTNKEIAAYAAGVFDGEGYLDIYQATLSKASKSPSLMLRVVISQKDGRIIDWLIEHFGGNVCIGRKDTKFSIYRWDIRSRHAKEFLKIISPYVIIKKPQVDLAIEYENKKSKYLETLKGKQGFRTLTKEELEWRIGIKEKIKMLKKEYAIYKGAATTTKRKDSKMEMQ